MNFARDPLTEAFAQGNALPVFVPGAALGAMMKPLFNAIVILELYVPSYQVAELRSAYDWTLVSLAAGDAEAVTHFRVLLMERMAKLLY